MCADVIDLTERRSAKAAEENVRVLRFDSIDDALEHAIRTVRQLQTLTAENLLLIAEDIEMPLAEVAAVIDEWRAHRGHPNHQGAR